MLARLMVTRGLPGAALACLLLVLGMAPADAGNRRWDRGSPHHGYGNYYRPHAQIYFPPVYYAPPPVYYAQSPVYYGPPQLTFVLPLRF